MTKKQMSKKYDFNEGSKSKKMYQFRIFTVDYLWSIYLGTTILLCSYFFIYFLFPGPLYHPVNLPTVTITNTTYCMFVRWLFGRFVVNVDMCALNRWIVILFFELTFSRDFFTFLLHCQYIVLNTRWHPARDYAQTKLSDAINYTRRLLLI